MMGALFRSVPAQSGLLRKTSKNSIRELVRICAKVNRSSLSRKLNTAFSFQGMRFNRSDHRDAVSQAFFWA